MPQRVKHPEWRKSHEPTKYPFNDNATLVNDDGAFILNNTFLDAAFYPVGGSARGYLSRVIITATTATLWYGDDDEEERAYGEFELVAPPNELRFIDTFGRPAGLTVSESLRMSVFQSWSIGEYLFEPDQTGLVAACCMPTPELGIRGVLLDDGSVMTGDVYLVGDNGVILSCSVAELSSDCSDEPLRQHTIRVDIVGDPLWRRRECSPGSFETPRFLKTLTFQRGQRHLTCGPGNYGDIKMIVGNKLAEDTILRVRPTEQGLYMEVVGERLEDIR